MVRRFYTCLFVFFLAGFSREQASAQGLFHLVDYGIYTVYVREPFTSAPDAYIDFATLDKPADSIPCRQGMYFGLRFTLQTDWLVKIPLTIQWLVPDTTDTLRNIYHLYQEKYKQTANDTAYAMYGLDEDRELMPGKWKCRILRKNKILFEKSFWLYRP